MQNRILLGACALCIAMTGVSVAQQVNVEPVVVGLVAEKLGVKLVPSAPRELELGRSATTTLAEPKKLAPYGISGMHEGARVTITCVGPNRLRVEAEEIEPVAQRAMVTLQVSTDGSLTRVPDRTAPARPAPK